MDIFLLLSFFGGLAVLLFGINTMNESLESIGSAEIGHRILKVTLNPFIAVALGAGITAAVQSSSAVTVMLVALADSGTIEFENTIGVIIGANIGTTVTAWITSTTSLEGGNGFLCFLKAENLGAVTAVLGIILILFFKKVNKGLGKSLLGFSVLIYGMELMKNSATPIAKFESFQSFFTSFNNPAVSVAFSAVFTGIIQSSSASAGILQSLCAVSTLTIGSAVPIIAGQNIGTCFTAVLSSIGASENAKKVVVVHILFNVLGAVVFLTLFYITDSLYHFSNKQAEPVTVAFIHSMFNILSAVVFLPLYIEIRKLVILHK